MFSLIWSAHKALKSVMGFLSMYRTSYVLSRCSKCEAVDDVNVDCEQCGKRVHTFWQDTVNKSIDYLRPSRPFADKIYVMSHNSRGYDAQFLLRSFLELRWEPKLIMNGSKILSMVVENFHFLDSLNFFQ
jgi:hypothetical protein